jgi:hypothetical protein
MPKVVTAACCLGGLLLAGTAYAGVPLKGVGHKNADRTACGSAAAQTGDCPKTDAPHSAPAPRADKIPG